MNTKNVDSMKWFGIVLMMACIAGISAAFAASSTGTTISGQSGTIVVGTNGVITVNVPANSVTVYNYTSANTLLTINSSGGGLIGIFMRNDTSNTLNGPSAYYTSFTKLLVLNFSITNSVPSNFIYTMIMPVPCGSNAAPYKLYNGTTWVEITPYTYNSVMCTITFNVPADPVVGAFSSVYVPPSSSGGTISGSSGGATGPQTTSGPNGCYDVSNLQKYDAFSVFLNQSDKCTINYITPTSAGVTTNGQSANYTVGYLRTYDAGTSHAFSVELMNISYLPAAQTITLQLCPVSATAPVTTTTTATTTASSTVPTTIMPTTTAQVVTTIAYTTVPSGGGGTTGGLSSTTMMIIAGAALVIALIIVAQYLLMRRNKA